MQFLHVLVAFLLLAAASTAQQPKQRGIEVGDLDRGVSPCEDFFEFANGRWRKENSIPASMVRWSRRWQAGELAKEQLRDILEDISRKRDWRRGSIEQLVGDHYTSCMDEQRVNQLGLDPVRPMLRQIESAQNVSDLQTVIRQLHESTINVGYSLRGAPDRHQPKMTIAHIGRGALGMPDRDYYLKADARFQEARQKYRTHVARMFELAGYGQARGRDAAETVIALETRLAATMFDRVELRNPRNLDNKMTFGELQKLTPRIDWAEYFDQGRLPRHHDVNVSEPKLLQALDHELATTPVDDWKIYLIWHVLTSSANALSEPFAVEWFNFNEAYLGGAAEMKPRWKRCVESTDTLLGEPLGQKYVERHFPAAAKARMEDLVKHILLAMRDTIEGLDWMGPQTKKEALHKLSTFHTKIGYPDKWKDHSTVQIRRDTFWENELAARRFSVADNWQTISKPTDRYRWGMTPPTSNAYYSPLLNEIVFPAGILQPPAFSMEYTDAVNYGAIGVVIGHEISHGFDDQGSQYDAEGRLRNWWTEEDQQRFRARAQCVVEQFEEYEVEPGIRHIGKLVLGESIGDLAGAKIAYLGFQKSQQGRPSAPTIDGFTPEQQFFISWGQFRGDAIRPETQRLMVQVGPHPTGKFRVIGPLSNMPEFQRAFQCKATDPMVRPPAKRCEVW